MGYQRKREGGCSVFIKKEDKSRLDVENVETIQAKGVAIWADEHHRTVHCICSSEWTTFHLHLVISYQCIWGWQHLQKPSPKCNVTYFFAIFPLWGSTHNSADCWSAHRSPAARDSFKRRHDWCKAGWCRPGAPPPTPTKILTVLVNRQIPFKYRACMRQRHLTEMKRQTTSTTPLISS